MWLLDLWQLSSHRLQVVHLWSRPSTPTDQIITRADYSYKGALHHVPGTRACSNRAPRVLGFICLWCLYVTRMCARQRETDCVRAPLLFVYVVHRLSGVQKIIQ